MRRSLLCAALALLACDSSRPPAQDGAGELLSLGRDPAAAAIARDTTLSAAQTAIDSGHPWRATQLLAPMLRDASRRTHVAALVGARAAAGWGGWAEVEKLLARETWVDGEFEGAARELLARSALERDDDTLALARTAAALRDAKAEPLRSVREVLYARALERNNMFDSAAVVYRHAAGVLRPVRDWLYLRAAGNEADSARRAALFAPVTLTQAKARIPWTDAQARERFSDALGAASRYAALGAVVPSYRLRLSVAPDSATRDVVKREVLAFIAAHENTLDARNAADVLDRAFPQLTPAEELVVGRGLSSASPARAARAYERAATVPGIVTPADRLAYADALSRSGRSRSALAQLRLVGTTSPFAAQAAYERARILLSSGTAGQTRDALRAVVTNYPRDMNAWTAAVALLADLSTDDGNDAAARELYRRLYRTYPASPRAPSARFHAAIIALTAGNSTAAAYEFDSLRTLMPRSSDALAATFWSGRAWAASGNAERAKQRWEAVVHAEPASYYGFASAKHLGRNSWAGPAAGDSIPRVAAVDRAVARMELLDRLGMDVEARFELDALDAAAGETPARLAATARAFVGHGQASRAIRLAQKLIDSGRADRAAYRLLYPVVDRDELGVAARANALDPVLVAALIRQESNFNPRALSVAGARGLMQVLPSVGASVARTLTYPVWSPALLFDPDANLQLGTAHLAAVIKQHGSVPRALAAYNAGGSRVARWLTREGMNDPELFAERIPFAETRDYVRLVQRNQEIYRHLYKW